ncbi:MAG TPA: hypothetical protein VN812_06170 [Candidatus Acidoferrales bacterium]|nr:hypothetical protein [Candidatus Acidoferrales bacterium]
MIALFGRDECSVLGIASLLDVEKIPYRRVRKLEDGDGELLIVATADLTALETASLERRSALVLNGGPQFARQVFGIAASRTSKVACAIDLHDRLWPAPVFELARRFGKTALRIPLAPVCTTEDEPSRGTIVAALHTGCATLQPAVMRHSRCVWSSVDLGAAFANLLTESYWPPDEASGARSAPIPRLRRTAENAYYAAPDWLRRRVQRRYYARLQQRLDAMDTPSDYPIDATGWLLIELVKHLIRIAAGGLVRLERWPAPYGAAATLTHDLEPKRYAYTTGLGRLLQRTATTGHPATLALVAQASEQYLSDEVVCRLKPHAIMCHGLTHRGEPVRGRAAVLANLHTARTRLERCVGRPVLGYRSPRLDRSADLAWALDQSDFRYDSSYPDVDRENIEHFGAGVRLNVPYRPLVDGVSGVLRPSRCLELPLSAPDCIQPLFAGEELAGLRATVERKAEFIRATGGLYVALVHAGVFGNRDAAIREAHLDFVCQQLRRADVWMTGIQDIAQWWTSREALRLSVHGSAVCVTNTGAQPIEGAQVVVEQGETEITLPVPALAPGAQATVTIPQRSSLPAA